MRRIVSLSLLSMVLITSMTGCGLFRKKKNAEMTNAEYPTVYQDPAGGTANAYPAQPAYDTYNTAPSGAAAYPTSGAMGGGRSYTVQKKDTLFSIARAQYNDQSRWKDIYEANRSELGGDPNRIRVGQRLTLP